MATTQVRWETTSVTVRRAGYGVLVSCAETGKTLFVPEDPAKEPAPTRTNERAAALIYASGRLLTLFRDALRAVSRSGLHPDQVVFEVLALHESGGDTYYREPPFGALELYYPDVIDWCTGRGHPQQVRRFLEALVRHEQGGPTHDLKADREIDAVPSDVGGGSVAGSALRDLMAGRSVPGDDGECMACSPLMGDDSCDQPRPDTDTTPESSPDWRERGSGRRAGG